MMIEAKPAKKRNGIYKFVIKEDVVFRNTLIAQTINNDWLRIQKNGDIIIKGSYKNGYAWDGCSMKVNVFDIFLIGIPDGRLNMNTGKPITYYASLIHDILYQFGKANGIKRKDVDKLFLEYLGDFSLRYIYYGAVRVFGIFFY